MTFAECLAFTWLPENDGQPYHVTPGDSGRGTAWAVDEATWTEWAAETGRPYALSAASKADLAALLFAKFWRPAGQLLPDGASLMVFDFGVNAGPSRSVKFLQSVLGIEQDGACGPISQRAAAAFFDTAALCQRLYGRQMAFYQADPDFARFGAGWTRRSDDRLAAALAALSQGATT